MKTNFYHLLVWLVAFSIGVPAMAQTGTERVKPFSHLSVSLNAGTLGGGLQVAAPLNDYLGLRAGFSLLKFNYNYDYDGTYEGPLPANARVRNEDPDRYYTVPLKAKANMANGMVLLDYFPFRRSVFHVTAGLLFGTSSILKVSGETDERIEVGDIIIEPGADGRVEAALKTNAVKPYVGLGFGRSVAHSRVGFKFELGAMFHGNPKIEATTGKIVEDAVDQELSRFNKFLKNFKAYPVLNFQLSYRIF